MQRRACDLELKFVGGEAAEFSGYGAVFGNVDAYGDVIAAGAFTETLASAKRTGRWPAMLLQHGGLTAEDNTPIGVWTDLEEDDRGLKVAGRLAETARGREVHALLKMQPRPALNGLSIGFRAREWALGKEQNDPRRTIKRIDLFEVSLVTFPANDEARVVDVKAIEAITSLSDAERILRDAGFSRREATAFVARLKSMSAQRESAAELDDCAAAVRRTIALMQI